MKTIATSLVLVFAIDGAASAASQTEPAPTTHAHHARAEDDAPQLDIPAAAQPAVAVVERFGQALAAGDFKTVEALLAPDVLILEAGGAERSREEYLGHHAISDAQFLKGSHNRLKRRRAGMEGGLAWVGTESALHIAQNGKPRTLLGTETMVLKNTADGWRIVHIHWSSRPDQPESASAEPTHRAHEDDTAQLLSGAGMGMSRVADANGFPGPRHVLDLADRLQLTAAQRADIGALHAQMQNKAVALGERIVATEAELGRLFADGQAEEGAISHLVDRIAGLRADLRLVHLRAHLATTPLLSPVQRDRYAALRH